MSPSRTDSDMRITVRDDGHGLPDPLDEGLGLQIVRSLVEQDLRGALTFTSSEAVGCEVSMDVPWIG